MRLLHTTDLTFEEFYEDELPPYVIISHRWERDEPSYQEFLSDADHSGPRYRKVRDACALAARGGWSFLWIDTICIDKKSSAELSEAINSMFRWYADAVHCFVYLSDVFWEPAEPFDRTRTPYYWDPLVTPTDLVESEKSFATSAWFSRGWTLQELLAPKFVSFYDYEWNRIGSRDGLREHIEQATWINLSTWTSACVAAKMSWLAHRKTSRGEDIAYCMLGLFDVNMPLLYGEGATKAFVRLQLEIIRKSDDESIFAWLQPLETWNPTVPVPVGLEVPVGLIALSPQRFADSGGVYIDQGMCQQRRPYAMTNKGLSFEYPTVRLKSLPVLGLVQPRALALNCCKSSRPVSIRLVYRGQAVWGRVNVHKWLQEDEVMPSLDRDTRKWYTETMYIKQRGI